MTQLQMPQPDASIKQAADNANDMWYRLALSLVKTVAHHHSSPEITADDIWDALAIWPDINTHEPRALGPVLLDAQRRGWIVPTDRVRASRRRQINHGRRITIWRSLIWQGQ